MSKLLLTLMAVTLSVLIFHSCSNPNRSTTANADIVSVENKESKQKISNETNTSKMLRETTLKFRVLDVQKSTLTIENLAVKNGGYTAISDFTVHEVENIINSKGSDSAIEIKKLEPKNHIEVFVLNSKLDTFLTAVMPLVNHLEYRKISAQELPVINENMKDNKDENKETMNAQYDRINFASNSASIKYTLVTMDIYQTPVVKQFTIPNPNSFEVSRGGFFNDTWENIKMGSRGVGHFISTLIIFWPLWILAIIVWIIIRKRMGKKIIPKFY